MRILLLIDRSEFKEKLAFFLQTTFQAQVTFAESFPKATQLLQGPPGQFALIIVNMKSGSPIEKEGFWSQVKGTVTLYFVHDPRELVPRWGYVTAVEEGTDFFETLEQKISALVETGRAGRLEDAENTDGLCRIKTELLLSVAPLRADIYIQLSEKKFLKIFREGDIFEQSDLEKYTIKKGIHYLYIRTEACEEFARKYREEIMSMLAQGDPSHDQIVKTSIPVHELVHQLSRQVGFSREVQELAKAQVQSTVQAMNKEANLAEILMKLKNESEGYVATHSVMTAYVACVIAKQVKWSSTTTYHKLTLAAFMHDIVFENDELAKLDTLAQLDDYRSHFTNEEVEMFKDHPTRVAGYARRFSEVPPDVDAIIAQHHERPDGSGFPRKLSGMLIAPLAALFIISHDLVQFFLKSDMKFDSTRFLAMAKTTYRSGHFKKIMTTTDVIRKIEELDRALKEGNLHASTMGSL